VVEKYTYHRDIFLSVIPFAKLGGCPTTNTAQHSLHWAVSHNQYCPALATYIGGCPTTNTAQHSLHWAVSHNQYCPALATYIGGCPTTNTVQPSLHWAVSHYQYCPALQLTVALWVNFGIPPSSTITSNLYSVFFS
jgi:hypothetical protein